MRTLVISAALWRFTSKHHLLHKHIAKDGPAIFHRSVLQNSMVLFFCMHRQHHLQQERAALCAELAQAAAPLGNGLYAAAAVAVSDPIGYR